MGTWAVCGPLHFGKSWFLQRLREHFAEVLPSFGLLPVAWGLGAAVLGAIGGSLVTDSRSTDPGSEAVLGSIEQALRER